MFICVIAFLYKFMYIILHCKVTDTKMCKWSFSTFLRKCSRPGSLIQRPCELHVVLLSLCAPRHRLSIIVHVHLYVTCYSFTLLGQMERNYNIFLWSGPH